MGVKAALLKDQGLNKQEVKKPNAGRGGGSGAGSRNRTQQREGFVKQSVKTTGSGQSTKTNTGKNQWVELIRSWRRNCFFPWLCLRLVNESAIYSRMVSGRRFDSSEKHETHIFCEKLISIIWLTELPQVTSSRTPLAV